MTNLKRTACGTVLATILGGCAAPIQTSGQLQDRLDSAQQISVAGPRDDALADVAKDAATGGQPSLCVQAIDGIVKPGLHDETAAACAETFNNLGDRTTADALVAKIQSVAQRDRIREAYAAQVPPMARF
jgi:hypothetical protein